MNEKTLRRFIAITSMGFAFCCLLWVAGSYLLLPVSAGEQDYSLMIKDPEWIYVAMIGLLSAIIGIFAVFGIYLTNRDHKGILLFTGTALLVLGLVFETAGLTWDVFIWPVICSDTAYISFITKGIFIQSPQFMIFFIALLAFLASGSVLFALGLGKTGKYGKLIPGLMITGIIFYIAGNFVSLHIASVGLCLYSIAFILIGMRTWKSL
jgi:hypothetical protein